MPCYLRFALVAATSTLVASVPSVARAQSALRFTPAFGQHTVGFRTVDQYDHSRSISPFDDEGRPRVHWRPIQTSIWYPSNAGAKATRMRYREYLELRAAPLSFPATDLAGKRAALQSLAQQFGPTDTARFGREVGAVMHAVRDASADGGKYPVIIYAPSFDAPSFENATLMEYLASFGYIVIASPSMGAHGPQSGDAVGMESQARDMEFLLAFARTIPGADVRKVGLMGFSWGGLSDVLVAMRNSTVSAVVTLDGSIQYFYHRLFEKAPFVAGRQLAIPALFLQQKQPDPSYFAGLGADSTGSSTFDFFRDLRHSDAYRVQLLTIGHQNFGEWFNRLMQKDNPVFVSDTVVQSRGYERIALYARHFLDAYLKGSVEGKAFLARSPADNGLTPSEVVVERKVAIPLPPSTIGEFVHALRERHQTVAAAPAFFAELRAAHPGYALEEGLVNGWGYRLMAAKRLEDAIGVLRMNVDAYPKSSNVYDSLGEAYANHNDIALAIENYERSLALDATNVNAVEWLKKLRARAKP